jgi:AmmeMemoRadiSam system protein B
MAIADVRPSPIAGTWYPGDRRQLAQSIADYLAAASLPELPGQVVGVISPHAGHRYSGRTAGHAFKAVQGADWERVVVLSPFHNFTSAAVLTSAHRSYATPLGEIPVDGEALAELGIALQQNHGPQLTPAAYDPEHSLEIELPFLQIALEKPFSLIPLMVRERNPHQLQGLGQALAQVLQTRPALVVASTDLSHFYTLREAEGLDGEMLRQMEAFSPEGVLQAEEKGTGFACGVSAVAAALWACRELGADRVVKLHHSTSAEQTGDRSSVVGYGAAAILKTV